MKSPGGRFGKRLAPGALEFSSSLAIDRRLARQDIAGSLVHAAMLERQGILTKKEASAIRRGLRAIDRGIAEGSIRLTPEALGGQRLAAEDVHMAVEHLLIERIGAAGEKLHAGRSRNDQVALDERLFMREAALDLMLSLRLLQRALVARGEEYRTCIMPGYTHLQRAQPILLAHHLLAYAEMLERDHGRIADCARRFDRSPLGAGALAGTGLPIDRHMTARMLGFGGIAANSIDAVSDRDAQIELIAACAIIMMHASRLAEELVLWSSAEWRFVILPEEYTTGSSIMPQKRNPDMAELARGKTGRVYGDLIALLTVMKGLPLAYNRDMQEDKEPLFDAVDTARATLGILTALLAGARFDAGRFEDELRGDFLLATELAEYLVRKGLPFRAAHAAVGAVVRECEAAGCSLQALPLARYRKHSPLFDKELYAVLDLHRALDAKASEGSTAPRQVLRALAQWKKKLAGAEYPARARTGKS